MRAMFRKQLFESSRGRIVALLQRSELTVDEIAEQLNLTANAVRAQITGMERDGVARRVGLRPGTTRPSQVYQLTEEVEQLLSRAYVPLLTQVIQVFAGRFPAPEVEDALRHAGRGLADELLAGQRPAGPLETRVTAASDLLNSQLGALTHVERNGEYVIRGRGCPLAAVTGKNPAVCLAMEAFVGEVIGAPVHECCDRLDRPRCCFKIHGE
jgi:DeoR family transcriptional regulator, suf operon transcriptional repressor